MDAILELQIAMLGSLWFVVLMIIITSKQQKVEQNFFSMLVANKFYIRPRSKFDVEQVEQSTHLFDN